MDYSILDEIDYKYPANDAYFAYMTRGCINKCAFCAVPTLEPEYCDYIGLKKQIEATVKRFGEQRDLLLLDNNVLASKCFEKIIDEIKDCGFQKGATYIPPNQYEIAIANLRDGFNDRAYIRKCIELYKRLMEKLSSEMKTEFYLRLEESGCLHHETATKEAILSLDEFVAPLYEKHFRHNKKVKRIVDYNQGIDARLINDRNMKKLSEINIYPLRIAFDHWEQRKIYETAVRTAVANGITNLSNYMLYNFMDRPEHLYYRMRLNVDLCEELGANIYSFPMKYHPINDQEFFMNRDYIGKHWNRKFIRAVQAVLNSTKGKIGKGKAFFDEAFGADEHRFWTIMWMPETFIIYRFQFKDNLPYDKFPKDRRRQCVFVGTSNKQRFLPLDRTGNRRFYPIQTNIEEAEAHVLDDEAATREYMRQLWAELMVIYRSGNWTLTLTPEMEHRLGVFRMNFMAEDTSTGMVQAWLDGYRSDYVCTKLLYNECYRMLGEPDRKAIGEINDIMNNTIDGWIPGPQHRFDRYGQQRSWVRVKPPDKADKADNEDRQLDLTDFTDCKDPDCPF